MNKIYSSKMLNILNLETILNVEKNIPLINNPADNQIAFMTSYGIVIGDIIESELHNQLSNMNTQAELISSALKDGIDLYHILPFMKKIQKKELTSELEVEFTSDGSMLALTNVKLCKKSLHDIILSSSIFYLHVDDVLGFFPLARDYKNQQGT